MNNRVYVLFDLYADELFGIYSSETLARQAACGLIRSGYSETELEQIANDLDFDSGEAMLSYLLAESDWRLEQKLEISIDCYKVEQ